MNKRHLRARLMRLLTATVIREDFSYNEQREIISFLREDEFQYDLLDTVTAIFHMLEDRGYSPSPSATNRPKKSEQVREDLSDRNRLLLDDILSFARRKKWSRGTLLDKIGAVDPNILDLIPKSATMSQIIEIFLECVSERNLEDFYSIVEIHSDGDPYLQGIAERKK